MRRLLLSLLCVSILGCDSSKIPGQGPAEPPAPPPPRPGGAVVAPLVVEAPSYPPTSEQQAIARKLAGSILVGGHALEDLRALTDDIGGRMTGSTAHAKAAAWAVDAFKRAGVADARLSPFTIQSGWQRLPVTLTMRTPRERPVRAEAVGWTPGTPNGPVTGELVLIKDASAPAREKLGSMEGKFALMDRDSLFPSGHNVVREASNWLKAHGAHAMFIGARRENAVMGAHAFTELNDLAGPLSAADVSREDYNALKRALEHGPVTVSYENLSVVTGPVQVPNVIAEIKGRQDPDEWVLVGAHLDSWDYAAGAQDNGSGAVEVIEAARAIQALGTPPRRSIRFALWGGEEQGMLGSMAYAEAHAAELDKLVMVLNTDNGAGAPKGWSVDGRDDAAPALGPLLKPLLGGLGDSLEGPFECNTDHCSFALRGIPALNLSVDMSKYDDVHHTAGDTVDKVSPQSLASAAAIVAITAYAVADAPGRLMTRLDHAAVAARLKKLGQFDGLVREGYLKP